MEGNNPTEIEGIKVTYSDDEYIAKAGLVTLLHPDYDVPFIAVSRTIAEAAREEELLGLIYSQIGYTLHDNDIYEADRYAIEQVGAEAVVNGIKILGSAVLGAYTGFWGSIDRMIILAQIRRRLGQLTILVA